MERIETLKCRAVGELVKERGSPGLKVLAVVSKGCRQIKNEDMEMKLGPIRFETWDQKVIIICYRIYWCSAKSSRYIGDLLRGTLSLCMEEVLFDQYEKGMALFCLIVESLPREWKPEPDTKKRIKEKVHLRITGVEKKSGAGSFKKGSG